jgi:hypothetical protein
MVTAINWPEITFVKFDQNGAGAEGIRFTCPQQIVFFIRLSALFVTLIKKCKQFLNVMLSKNSYDRK